MEVDNVKRTNFILFLRIPRTLRKTASKERAHLN